MKSKKLNKLIHGNGGICPHCSKHTQPIKKNFQLFCSECHIHLWEKTENTSSKQVSLAKKTIISLGKGFLLALCWFPIWFIMAHYELDDILFHHPFKLLLMMMTVVAVIFVGEKLLSYIKGEKSHFEAGIDFLEDFEADDQGYKAVRGFRVPDCKQCGSKRMADLYHFKRSFIQDKESSIPKISIDEVNFVGCLHCKARYEMVKPKTDYTKLILFIMLLVFGSVLFLLYHEIIMTYIADSTIKHAIGLFMAGWFYGVLMSLPKEEMNREPYVKLKKLPNACS